MTNEKFRNHVITIMEDLWKEERAIVLSVYESEMELIEVLESNCETRRAILATLRNDLEAKAAKTA